MSVIVKGMDMPKNCAYCPLSEYRNTSLGQILDCKRIGTVGSAVRGTHDVLNHRHPNCPLVDSPEPHWIPVTKSCECDLMDNEEVLVFQKDGTLNGQIRHAMFYDFDGKKKFVTWEEGITIYDVVAYMPLSELYKGVTE